MAEYIERRRLFNALADYWKIPLDWDGGIAQPCEDALAFIENAPEEDVALVVHGRWVDHMCRDWRCSECGEKIHKVRNVDGYCYDDKPNYCPNCGARMDGDSNG